MTDATKDQTRSADDFVRSLAKGGGILVAGFAFEVGLSFVAKIVMARVLGRASYGSVSIGIVLAANLSTIALLGLHVGVARYLPRRGDGAFQRGVLVAAYRIIVPVSLLISGVVFAAAGPLSEIVFTDASVAPLVRVFALAVPFGAVMKLSVGAIRGSQRSYPKALVQNVTQPLTRFALVIGALAMGFQTLGVAWAYFGAYALAAIVAGYFVVRYTPLTDSIVPKRIDRELLSFSAPLGVTSIATLIVSGIGIDTVMIAFFVSTAAVGDYNVIYPVASLLLVVFNALSFLFMPILSELEAEGRTAEMGRLLQVVTKWLFLGALPLALGLILVPNRIIDITFGAEYQNVTLSLAVLAAGFFVHTVLGANRGVLESVGETRLVMYDMVGAASVNIMINLLLIPRLGVLGASIGTTAAYVTLNVFYLVQGYRTLGVQPFTASLVKPGIVAVVLVVGVFTAITTATRLTNTLLFLVLPPLAVLYGVVILRFGGIEREELMLVLSFEERFNVDTGYFKRIAKRLMG